MCVRASCASCACVRVRASCACMRARARVRVRASCACVRACVCVCVRVRACVRPRASCACAMCVCACVRLPGGARAPQRKHSVRLAKLCDEHFSQFQSPAVRQRAAMGQLVATGQLVEAGQRRCAAHFSVTCGRKEGGMWADGMTGSKHCHHKGTEIRPEGTRVLLHRGGPTVLEVDRRLAATPAVAATPPVHA